MKRPRTHELETLSRQHFRAVFPPAWIIRAQEPDYGLDEMVQIVLSGEITPWFFGVQLKASDGIIPDQAEPSWSFPTTHLRHYLTLPFPVMLVLFDARKERLFYTWVHRFFRSRTSEQLRAWMTQETVTVTFREQLTPDIVPAAGEEAQVFHETRSPDTATPVDLHVALELDSKQAPLALQRFISILASSAADKDLRVVMKPGPGQVVMTAQCVRVDASNYGMTIDIDAPVSTPEWESNTVASLTACAAVLLASRQRTRASLQLLGKLATTRSKMPASVEAALCGLPLPFFYASGVSAGDVLNVAGAFLQQGAIDAATWLSTASLFSENSDLERRQGEDLLVRAIDLLSPSPRRAAIHYTLANALRSHSDHRRAIAHYRRAALEDSYYLSAPYWWAELGGSLFQVRRFRCSAISYARSLEFADATPHTAPLLADALIRTGRFRESATLLSNYVRKTRLPRPNAILLEWFATDFLRGRSDGTPDHQRVAEVLRNAEGSDSDSEKERLWREATAIDPLCALPHYNLGLTLASRGAEVDAAREFLASAICTPQDPEAWAYAILMLMRLGRQHELLAATLACANLNSTEVEFQVATKLAQSGWSGEKIDAFLGDLRRVTDELSWIFSYPASPTLRVWSPPLPG